MPPDDHLSIVDSLDDAIAVVDGERRIVAWNPAMERCTGRARGQAVGHFVEDAFGALPATLWTRPVALALAGERGRGPSVTATLRAATVCLEPQWAPRADAPGAVITFRDVTEESKRVLVVRALQTAGRSIAASLDLDQVLETVAEKTRDLLGAEAAMVVSWDGRSETLNLLRGSGRLTREYAPSGIPLAGGPVSVAVREGRVVATPDILADPRWELDTVRRRHIAREGFKAVAAAPLIVKGEVRGALAVHQWTARTFTADETTVLALLAEQAALALENARLYAESQRERHEATAVADRLKDTQAQLVQAAKLGALGQLVSGVAHELNNPLSVIIGYGQLLLARDVPATLRRPIELMVSQGDRMAKIVRNLLFFARQRPPERVPVDVKEVLEQALALRLNQLALSSISVRREYVETLPTISADGGQLQQVFLNLLLNAEQAIIGATRPGTILARVDLGPSAETVIVQIVDDGPGIAPDVVGRVFEPFFTTKEVGQGTGLGLSVSYGIVQEHNGRLTVESRPGATTFTLELPIRSAPTQPRGIIPVLANSGEGRPALVVEDEPAVLDLVVTMLTESGWQVDVAAGGKTGLERVHGRRYDLIVSDIRMPEGGGDEFYRRAIAHDPGLAKRFLFVTGDTANPDAWRFLKDAQVPVLEKPFAAKAFLDAVRAISLTRSPSPA